MASAAELGRALASLIRGTLPEPPPNTLWFYGPPGGRRTIRMPSPDGRGADSAPSEADEHVPVFRFREGEDPDAVIDDLIRSKQRIQAVKAVKERYGIPWVEAHHVCSPAMSRYMVTVPIRQEVDGPARRPQRRMARAGDVAEEIGQ